MTSKQLGSKHEQEVSMEKVSQSVSSRYTVDVDTGVWVSQEREAFDYSDDDTAENYIYQVLRKAGDISCSSDELTRWIRDWPSEYHLSAALAHPFGSSAD